jgi:thiol-disulfide isomerase/thioredoxin
LLLWWVLFSAPLIDPSLLIAQASTPGPNRVAPDFSRTTLSKKKITLASYRGKVVLLNFWATWCNPCLTETPTFVEWQKAYGPDKFQVIGVSMDDDAGPVSATVSRLKINYPVLIGDENLGEAYGGILGLPVTFLIDRKGIIQARYQGVADLAQLKHDVEGLLKDQ